MLSLKIRRGVGILKEACTPVCFITFITVGIVFRVTGGKIKLLKAIWRTVNGSELYSIYNDIPQLLRLLYSFYSFRLPTVVLRFSEQFML